MPDLGFDFTGQVEPIWWVVIQGFLALSLLAYAWRRRSGRRWPLALGLLALVPIIRHVALPDAAPTFLFIWLLITLPATLALIYLRPSLVLTRRRLVGLWALRTLATLSLILLIFEPTLTWIERPETQRFLAVVLDASGSMSITDEARGTSRYRRGLEAVSKLQSQLSALYHLDLFAYDGLHNVALDSRDALEEIVPRGKKTDLPEALKLARGASQAILLSDGIQNGPGLVTEDLPNFPIHTLRIGSETLQAAGVPDVGIVKIEGPQTALVHNEVALNVRIRSTSMSDRSVQVRLLDGEKLLDQQPLILHSGPHLQDVTLKITPEKVGRLLLRVMIPADPIERTDLNNTLDWTLLVRDPKLPVLYVEGRVRPEVGPLRRSLETDPNLQAVTMVRTQPDHFEIRGGTSLKLTGLPKTLAQWKLFRVVILGDLEAKSLSPQAWSDLETAVRDEGTGLAMIGGARNFAAGGWDQTPLQQMLPVELTLEQPPQLTDPFVPQLTSQGSAHPIFRGLEAYFPLLSGPAPAQQVPPLTGCVSLGSPKAAAEVLAIHPSAKLRGRPATVLAAQTYGKGRTIAFAADTTYQWNLFLRAQGKDSPYHRFWGQMVRFLAGQDNLLRQSGASVVSLMARNRFEPGDTLDLRVAVTDSQGQATAFAETQVELRDPTGVTERLAMLPVADQPGIYELEYHPRRQGDYQARFTARKEALSLGQDQTHWSVEPTAGEMEQLAARPDLLHKIAQKTGGLALEVTQIDALVHQLKETLPPEARPVRHSMALVHGPAYFLFFILTLSLEWFLRRRWR